MIFRRFELPFKLTLLPHRSYPRHRVEPAIISFSALSLSHCASPPDSSASPCGLAFKSATAANNLLHFNTGSTLRSRQQLICSLTDWPLTVKIALSCEITIKQSLAQQRNNFRSDFDSLAEIAISGSVGTLSKFAASSPHQSLRINNSIDSRPENNHCCNDVKPLAKFDIRHNLQPLARLKLCSLKRTFRPLGTALSLILLSLTFPCTGNPNNAN